MQDARTLPIISEIGDVSCSDNRSCLTTICLRFFYSYSSLLNWIVYTELEMINLSDDSYLSYSSNTSPYNGQTHVRLQDQVKHRSSPRRAKDFLHTSRIWATTPLIEGALISLEFAPLFTILPA
jgi:hypothetical protein